MQKCLPVLALLTAVAHADLVITEVMSSSRHLNTGFNGDWWELTNTGPGTQNLNDLRWHDTINGSNQLIFPSYVMQAGESVIILNEADFAPFKNVWGLGAEVTVFIRSDFSGDAAGDLPGLSSGGDTVYLFQNNGNIITSFTFGLATTGASFGRFSDGAPVPGGISVNGQFGAYQSTAPQRDVASPSTAPAPPSPLPPEFTGQTNMTWIVDQAIDQSDFRVQAVDPNSEDTITLTVDAKPAWLTITDLGGGFAQLTGTPTVNELGRNSFTMRAVDSSGTTAAVTQEYFVDISPATSTVILNEYNAVSNNMFLGGGAKNDAGAPSDPEFERIEGNGGEWVEFAVVGDGTAGSTVDMRGWSVILSSDVGTTTLKLSTNIAWSAIPAGTLLTFTRENSLTTGFNIRSELNTIGTAWSNVWMAHPVLIDLAASTIADRAISSSNTVITLLDASDMVVYGPNGESISGVDDNMNSFPDRLISVSDIEVFKLEANATPAVNPTAVTYDDGSTSTFGRPNRWNNNLNTQSFAAFVTAGTPPTLLTIPSPYASRGNYNWSSTFAAGTQVTALEKPDFLNLQNPTPGVFELVNNRPLTVADIGTYPITLQIELGGQITYYPYQLQVFHPSPAVVLNEANAVLDINYLNGGKEEEDSDGLPNATDSHFGRVPGNGGDWFELAVVDSGTPGFINLQGWKIEVGRFDNKQNFVAVDTLTLTDHPYWMDVPAGTLLTFIENDTAGGGLDSDLNRVDNLSTQGWAWSNISLGDTSLVTIVGLPEIEIDSNNTLFRISDSSGTVIFGPAGEGVAPLSGISSTEILELEADASPLISPVDVKTDTAAGYDDGSSSSTFGAPNLFAPPGAAVDRAQDFTAFTSTVFSRWVSEFDLGSPDLNTDPDGDGHSILEEYLYGGSPIDGTSTPQVSIDPSTGSVTFDIRTDDPTYAPVGERSDDLVDWVTEGFPMTFEATSPLGLSYKRRSFTYDGDAPKMFFRVFQP